ncbi:12855_t:CDS:2 [Ambispora gerdemannii]|uniref:12855_t:CDS:1 n=1 Tax=Ambispora gerdemannii TaxID=144530 RepID=A0A9N8WEQ9_9GLOM|nr:12855_t:CDS:2 [Ambispora gerdemannii]
MKSEKQKITQDLSYKQNNKYSPYPEQNNNTCLPYSRRNSNASPQYPEQYGSDLSVGSYIFAPPLENFVRNMMPIFATEYTMEPESYYETTSNSSPPQKKISQNSTLDCNIDSRFF